LAADRSFSAGETVTRTGLKQVLGGLKSLLMVQPKNKNVQENVFFSAPNIIFTVKILCLLPFSTRLRFLINFSNTFQIQILKRKK